MRPLPRPARPPGPPRPRSNATLLAALLVCTLVLATMLAYEAHDAARSHRATAERALHDYAAVAAWEMVAGVNDELQSTIGAALAPLTRTRATSPYELLPAPNLLASSADGALRCANPAADSGRFYFRLDFRDGTLATFGAQPTPEIQQWLTDTITSHGRTVYQSDWDFAVVVGGPRPTERATIVYAVKYAEHRAPIAAFGLRTCGDVIGPAMLRAILAKRSLLPASVTGGAPNDSIVDLTIRDPSGAVLYQNGRADSSPYAASAPLEQVGALSVRAAIRQRAVDQLALGALPGSRVPLLVGLLTLTAAMIAITIMQLRREHELTRLRSDFISSVSHELRTPLSQILLFAETLNLGRVRTDQERQGATDVIVQEGRRLMHLVENILHFSRAERHMARLGLEPLDLSQAARAIVDDWMPLAATAGMTIDAAYQPDVLAMADRSALRQMVLNLLDNAVKYGARSPRVTIGTSIVAGRPRLWVEDEGEGIPPRERERIWQSFYRLERHANSSVAGSGIGLYVVRELARLHGGEAWVEDGARGGARFVIELQAAERARGFTGEHVAATMPSAASAEASKV